MSRRMTTMLVLTMVGALLNGCGMPPAGQTGVGLAGMARATEAQKRVPLHLDRGLFRPQSLAPVVAKGPGEFDNALAMDLPYAPILALRQQLQKSLGRPLTFFKGWNPHGEAHVTVLTPVEFQRMVRGMKPGSRPLTMDEIGAIAVAEGIQTADLTVRGLGSGRLAIAGQTEETYFVIVESQALRRIRQAIHARNVARGGDPTAFAPDHFFPHITIGFTARDLHEADGVLKDAAHSLDPRFELRLR